jgi:hypothetical protein
MTTSSSYDFSTNRNGIISRALRIINAVGLGETPSATDITNAAEALNQLVKEWQTDGMPLWALKAYAFPLVASQSAYTIGPSGADVTAEAPLNVISAIIRQTSTLIDTPIRIITRVEYRELSTKFTNPTRPHTVSYNTPGGNDVFLHGTLNVYPVPDARTASDYTIRVFGQRPFQDFDASTDEPDFPQYWHNALVWGLADQLAYEYGLGLAERSMITKKANEHKEKASSFGTEEGSYSVQPRLYY